MCSYNKINGIYGCENSETLGHLYEDMGFDGWVLSDWTATHSTSDALNAGLFMEMPFGTFYSEKAVTSALESGEVSMETIDNGILRILTAMYDVGLFDHEPVGDRNAIVTSEEHSQLARELAAKSTVLLKNDVVGEVPLLPLSVKGTSCIAVIGDNSTITGNGSGHVIPAYFVTPEQGIRNALIAAGDSVSVIYNDGKDLDDAITLAKQCETVVVSVATTSGEGSDRPTLGLGDSQDELVVSIASVNPRTIVSVVSPGAVLMPWSKDVSAIVESWLPGQEAGNALADILFGNINPSARLHVTMPNRDNEVNFTPRQFPGVGHPPSAYYTEGLLIGYRYYDAHQIIPNFCFGHGLSYTSFEYKNIKVASGSESNTFTVFVEITNTGTVSGSDIPQLYLTFPVEATEPPKILRGFSKVYLAPDTSTSVEFFLNQRDISIWDAMTHDWKVIPGSYHAHVGASSCDIKGTVSFDVV